MTQIHTIRSDYGLNGDRPVTCADPDGAQRAIRRAVDLYARTEMDVVDFRQRHINRDVTTNPNCRVSVYGEITAHWRDGTVTNEAFDVGALPARNGGKGWVIDGPYFYDPPNPEAN